MRAAEVAPLRLLLAEKQALTVIDAGANKGFWSKAFLSEFESCVDHVYMIDASPENVRELCRRDDNMMFSPDDLSRISAHHFAVGAQSGVATLYTNDDGSPLASLYAHEVNGYSHEGMAEIKLSKEITVPLRTIDGFLSAQNIEHVDVLKIDVEGYELQALHGAKNALRANRIDVIAFEFGMHQVEARNFFFDFYNFLSENHYRMYAVVGGTAHPLDRYEYRFEKFDDNYIFFAECLSSPRLDNPDGVDNGSKSQADDKEEEVPVDLRSDKSRMSDALEEISQLKSEIQTRDALLKQSMANLAKAFTESTSWRLTSPLRMLRTALQTRR